MRLSIQSRGPVAGPTGLAALLLAVSTFLSPAPMAAQLDEEVRRHGIFLESVEVSLVSIEVFASRDGEAVTDLTRQEFEILDDGQPVEISHFAPIARVVGEAATGDREEAEERPAEGLRRMPTSEPPTVILLVDQLFVSAGNRARVFAELNRSLEPLFAAGARILVAQKTHQVSIEQPLTGNRALVEEALERLSKAATPGYANEVRSLAELWEVTPQAGDSRRSGPGQPPPALETSELDAQSAYREARSLSQRIHEDVRRSLAALEQFLGSLAGLPGRKSLIYVADALPVRPGELLWRIWWERYGVEHGARLGVTPTGPSELELSSQLEELISDANADRVTFYPIGADAGANLSTADSRGVSTPGRPLLRLSGATSTDGLGWLASRTGGRSAPSTGSLSRLVDGLVRDLENYYEIAWPSPHGGDGEIHRLEVRVTRPGVKLRHPTEYRAESVDRQLADRALSALTLGVEENALDIRVEVGKAKRREKGLWALPVAIHVPLVNLVLLPDSRAHHGKLSLQLAARDEAGRVSDPMVVRLPLEVLHGDMARALSQTVDYETEILLREGPHTLAVAIRDDFGSTRSIVAVEVEAGNP